jgi:hypothetical protein
LAIGCLASVMPFFALLSAATVLVLLGLGSRPLAAINAVAVIAACLIAFVFLPATREIGDRTERGMTNLVLTATSSEGFGAQPAYVFTGTVIAIPTFPSYDFDDNPGAVLPER